jgi:DNA ligase-1
MLAFSHAADRIAATAKRLEKIAVVAELLISLPPDDASAAAIFLSGRPFPAYDEATLQVGGSLLWRLLAEISGRDGSALNDAYRRLGDAGAVAADVLPVPAQPRDLTPRELEQTFRAIAAARGPAAKAAILRPLLAEVAPLDAKYIVKIVTSDLRIGLKESLVEEGIAKAYGATLAQVQRANMLLGDIGETLRYAAGQRLAEARMQLFHPLGFMLATPAENAGEALSYFAGALVEDKFDGIRAQVHIANGRVEIFSRTRDAITQSFPELVPVFAQFPHSAILDGEIVAWAYGAEEEFNSTGRALPFSRLQQRLGRKKVSQQLMRDVPIAYLVFDILYADDRLLIDEPLARRAQILDELLSTPKTSGAPSFAPFEGWGSSPQSRLIFSAEEIDRVPEIIRSPLFRAKSPAELDALFDAAQARGNEGLMIKDPQSPYTPGRRGRAWLKMKRELATLDVVVTAVEHGHGRRINVLSDYTFAVWDGDKLVNIGKAYSGLTDSEIEEMTRWFHEHTLEDQGFRKIVEPKIVLEVAFNNMMRSDRHSSGLALRFPRIVRLRPDKLPSEADTLETARRIYEKEHKRPTKS